MGDFSNYEKQGARPGHTVGYEVTELRNADGTHPLLHVEHVGISNPAFMQWALANAGKETSEDDREMVVRFGARHLERTFFADGSQATDDDLPKFIAAMPLRAFLRLRDFVMLESNFCEFPVIADPKALAEK
jgi:hypothetical protein